MDEVFGQAWLSSAVDLLVRLVEAAGAAVIFVGAAVAFVQFVGAAVRTRRPDSFVLIRLGLGRAWGPVEQQALQRVGQLALRMVERADGAQKAA